MVWNCQNCYGVLSEQLTLTSLYILQLCVLGTLLILWIDCTHLTHTYIYSYYFLFLIWFRISSKEAASVIWLYRCNESCTYTMTKIQFNSILDSITALTFLTVLFVILACLTVFVKIVQIHFFWKQTHLQHWLLELPLNQ